MQRKFLEVLIIVIVVVLLNCCFSSQAKADEKLYYINSDHLGSTTLITDEGGNVISQQSYYPYGETRASTSTLPTERAYTGQVSDADQTGLYYYNARYYNPQIAKFTQADSKPESLNKYQYVGNNPIVYKDQTGNSCTPSGNDPLQAAYCMFIDPVVSIWNSVSANAVENEVMVRANNDNPAIAGYYMADTLSFGAVRAIGDSLYKYAEVNAEANAAGEPMLSGSRIGAAVNAGVPLSLAAFPIAKRLNSGVKQALKGPSVAGSLERQQALDEIARYRVSEEGLEIYRNVESVIQAADGSATTLQLRVSSYAPFDIDPALSRSLNRMYMVQATDEALLRAGKISANEMTEFAAYRTSAGEIKYVALAQEGWYVGLEGAGVQYYDDFNSFWQAVGEGSTYLGQIN